MDSPEPPRTLLPPDEVACSHCHSVGSVAGIPCARCNSTGRVSPSTAPCPCLRCRLEREPRAPLTPSPE